MTLDEGLDELRTGILRDTSTLKSGPPDQYWTDDRLVKYIDDAHKRFARLSLCIHDDTTPAVTQISLLTGVDTYVLDPSVMMVLSARHTDDVQDMVRLIHQNIAGQSNTYTESFELALTAPTGKPTRFSTDEGLDPTTNHAIRMRFIGVPDSTQDTKIVYLRVIRKPLLPLTTDDTTVTFEIPEDYHLDMLEWAAYRALRNWDVDGEDRSKAEKHRDRFNEAVAECKKEIQRKLWAPLSWRFGSNGFSYEKN